MYRDVIIKKNTGPTKYEFLPATSKRFVAANGATSTLNEDLSLTNSDDAVAFQTVGPQSTRVITPRPPTATTAACHLSKVEALPASDRPR